MSIYWSDRPNVMKAKYRLHAIPPLMAFRPLLKKKSDDPYLKFMTLLNFFVADAPVKKKKTVLILFYPLPWHFLDTKYKTVKIFCL